MKDWLGKEYDVGDLVLYAPRGYGGINMYIGEVVRFTPTRVVVRPIASARYGKCRDSYIMIDKRTGKKLRPYEWQNKEHMERDSGYLLEDGTYISHSQLQQYPWRARPKVTYAAPIWKSYVVKVNTYARPVALQIVKNVTKWEGTLPEWENQAS